jgi:dipeptidyl-peptidase-4
MNRKKWLAIIWLLWMAFFNPVVNAQLKTLSLSDAIIGPYTKFRPESMMQLQWRPGTSSYVWQKGDSLLQQDALSEKSSFLVSLQELNEVLTKDGKPVFKSFPTVKWVNTNVIRLFGAGQLFEFDLDDNSIQRFQALPENAKNPDISQNGITFTKGADLFLQDLKGEIIRITRSKKEGVIYGQTVHRNEFGINKGTFWSSDGAHLAFYRKDESMVSFYPLVDVMQREAKLRNIRYPMAGMTSEQVTIGIYNLNTRKTVYLKTGKPEDQYLTNIAWSPENEFVYVAVLNREQNHMKLNKYSAETGEFIQTLFEESHPKYVEPLQPIRFLKKHPDRFIYESRSNGYNHVYLYDISGEMIRQLIKGEFDVTYVAGFDPKEQFMYFVSTMESPVERHIYKVNMKSGKIQKLSTDQGTHSASLSPDAKFFIDTYSNVKEPKIIHITRTNGKIIRELLHAQNPYKDVKLGEIELSSIQETGEHPELFYRLIKPVDFDSTKKYPVIVYVYGGPHSQLVTNSWLGGSRMWQHYMANKGYIAFTLDNRGTSGRGFDFENSIHRQLGKLEVLDQMAGIDYLLNLPYVDKDRIGVHGWSYGGFMTLNLILKHPEIFKVAVAGGPVTDWKYYEIMYGERYMDMPDENPEGYKAADMKNYVDSLKGNLLIIHGAMDSTVVWQHSLTFIRECVKKGKQPDYFVYPTHPHNVRGWDRIHLMEKVSRYFDDHL